MVNIWVTLYSKVLFVKISLNELTLAVYLQRLFSFVNASS